MSGLEKPVIRKATISDADTIYGMICALENLMLNRQNFDFVYRNNIQNEFVGYFLADINGEAVGMGSCHVQTLLHHAAFVAEVQEMFVYEEHRSKNVGKVLMESLVAFAKSKGAIQIEVTSRSYRESAHRFYEREGFDKSHVKLVRYF